MRASDSLPRSVLTRIAVVYIRQSTPAQVRDNLESQRRQYDLVEVARRHGFARVDVIDEDLGLSASGAVARLGFERLVARLCTGEIGAVLCFEASRPAPCTSRSRERGLPLAGDPRMPAVPQLVPSALSLPAIRFNILCRLHGLRIIVPLQGSGRHSVSGESLRHDGEPTTA